MHRCCWSPLLACGLAVALAACGDPTSGPSPAGPAPPGAAADLVADGLARMRRGDAEGAIAALREARARRPADGAIAFYLGRLLHADTKLGEAEEAYRAAVAADPTLAEGWLRLSEILVEQGRLEEALASLESLGRIRGGGPNLDYQVGFVLSKMGRHEQAEGHLRTSLQQEPRNPNAWYVLGLNAQRQGEDEQAAGAFRSALEADPAYADAWFNLGNALARLGRPEEARQALERFAAVNEARERDAARQARLVALQRGAEMDLERGRPESAASQVEEAATLDAGAPWVHRLRGELLLQAARRDEALDSLRRAAALNPDAPEEQLALAAAFSKAGDEEAARRHRQVAQSLLAGGGGAQ